MTRALHMIIRHLRTNVADRVPPAEVMEEGRIAINLADRRIFTKNTEGEVVVLAQPQEPADWDATSGSSQILNKPTGIVTEEGAQTLNNKTLGTGIAEGVLESSVPSLTVNVETPPFIDYTPSENASITITLPVGVSRNLWVKAGTYTVTWPIMQWVGGSAPSLSSTGYSLITVTGIPGGGHLGALVWSDE